MIFIDYADKGQFKKPETILTWKWTAKEPACWKKVRPQLQAT